MHLFLSPHLDDAVYSCGGTIRQLTSAGETVIVVTLMAGIPTIPLPDTPILADLHQRWAAGDNPIRVRHHEDAQACALLGATPAHGTIPDCVYRVGQRSAQALYPTEASLWDEINPDDWALADLLNNKLPIPNEDLRDVTRLYAPLGAGGHVDHLLVNRLALQYKVQDYYGFEIWFYEDFPYCNHPDAVLKAKQRLAGHVSLVPQRIHLTEPEIAAKIEGVKAYQSQVSTFWEDEAALEAGVRASLSRGDSPPAEYYHQITD